MLQVQGCYGLENLSKVGGILNAQQQMNSLVHTEKDDAGVLISSSGQKIPQEKKSTEAANKHALAERNRRKRINHHLNTLRKLFPNLPKSDKPRVLTETVRCLKELRKKVADHVVIMESSEERCCIDGKGNCLLFLPGEKDEVDVSYCEGGDDQGEGRIMVKATICCEDRQRLNRDLMEAVRSTKGRVVKAEMATIGGRTKAVLVVQWCKEVDSGGGGEEELGSLRRALKAAVENRALCFSSLLGPKSSNSGSTSLGLEGERACGSIGDGPSSMDGVFIKTE